jgi:5-methylcytosine-specific restriction endonuclease McrA
MASWPYSTQRWQRLRKTKLFADPWCEYCPPGSATAATQVDHRTPIADGGDPWAWDQLVSTCGPCHSRKTRYLDVLGKDRVPVKGVDPETGRPLDPGHWWNRR